MLNPKIFLSLSFPFIFTPTSASLKAGYLIQRDTPSSAGHELSPLEPIPLLDISQTNSSIGLLGAFAWPPSRAWPFSIESQSSPRAPDSRVELRFTFRDPGIITGRGQRHLCQQAFFDFNHQVWPAARSSLRHKVIQYHPHQEYNLDMIFHYVVPAAPPWLWAVGASAMSNLYRITDVAGCRSFTVRIEFSYAKNARVRTNRLHGSRRILAERAR